MKSIGKFAKFALLLATLFVLVLPLVACAPQPIAGVQAFTMPPIVAGILADVQFKILTSAIVLNLVLAVACAAMTKTFDWKKLAEFARVQFVPFLVAWIALRLFDSYSTLSVDIPGVGQVGAFSTLAFAAMVANLAANTKENIAALFPKKPA
jgi:hypothetical protein